jgi:SAM-dependent methyltransferase
MPMTELCDLCRSPDLEPLYQPAGSERGLDVYVCTDCGLVQSLPRIDRAPRRAAAISSGADWGNVRYGKGFRTHACLSLMRTQADFGARLSVLDVGSNRGAFARAFLAAAPEASLTCVEPDERVAGSCAGLDRAELIRTRIEDTRLPDAGFDIVHSCHTIEHLASPARTLADHWRVLKPGGLLIVDAPDIALIGAEDIVEEWFIDKHLYHFSKKTLAHCLESSGFEIVGAPDASDRENLLFAARKGPIGAGIVQQDSDEVAAALSLVTAYVTNRARNLSVLTHVAAEIASLAPKGVALWGAGRLFDALVTHGGFNPKSLRLLIDTHLKAHAGERHGVALSSPEALPAADIGAIVVMSRAFSGEIARAAAQAAPNAQILLYSDLLARARAKRAA